MYRKQVNEQSPLRILEGSIHGGLGKGNLGVVMARAGVGKTACMVQIGLDDLMRNKGVLHIALEQTLEHMHSWYDALFDDLARRTQLEDRDAVHASVTRHRIIQTYADGFDADRLRQALGRFDQHLKFKPEAILVDGYNWHAGKAGLRTLLGQLKECARETGAELWMSAQTRRADTGDHPTRIPQPCETVADLIDVALFLEPHDHHVSVRLLKDHGSATPDETRLKLQPDTLRLVSDVRERVQTGKLPTTAFTLLSGAANGAEAEFGACAEKWGLLEANFTFEGHQVARTRGLVTLTEGELRQGDVSSAYLTAHMHRTYPNTPLFRKVLQSIWHQVNTSGEVFVVGAVLPDGTVKGGTGWAAELARHAHKPVYVFDQEQGSWFTWQGKKWLAEPPPTISRRRFTGTGTRFLNDSGREAIRNLFARTFGPR
jgi:hypothetical protein